MAKIPAKLLTKAEHDVLRATEKARMAELDEDELVELHGRIRRARNKAVKNYRRGAAGTVGKAGGRGKAHGQTRSAAAKAEVFEDALARVSRALAKAARDSAAELKAERLAAAGKQRAGAASRSSGGRAARSSSSTGSSSAKAKRRTPATKKASASARAAGKRQQAKRDRR